MTEPGFDPALARTWLLDILQSGVLPNYGVQDATICPAEFLVDSYLDHADKDHVRRSDLWEWIATVIPDLEVRSSYPYRHPVIASKSKRGRCLKFSPLTVCRFALAKTLHQVIDWRNPEADWRLGS
jgi:hypothetical protein